MFSYSVLTLLLLHEPQLYSAVSSEIQVSLRNHCRSRSVTIMLHAQSLTSVPVCRCSALLKAVGLYQFTHYFWSNCHTALFILKNKTLEYLFERNRWHQNGEMQEDRDFISGSKFNSSMPRLPLSRRSDERHFNALLCFGNHLVLGSDSVTTPSACNNASLCFPHKTNKAEIWFNVNRSTSQMTLLKRGCNATGYLTLISYTAESASR